jgi:hypothetical protein
MLFLFITTRRKLMHIKITLSGSGGPLEEITISPKDDDDSAEISGFIWEAIDHWVLAPGDTIKIEEV